MPLPQPPSNSIRHLRAAHLGNCAYSARDVLVKQTIGKTREEGGGEVVGCEELVRGAFALAVDEDVGFGAVGAEEERGLGGDWVGFVLAFEELGGLAGSSCILIRISSRKTFVETAKSVDVDVRVWGHLSTHRIRNPIRKPRKLNVLPLPLRIQHRHQIPRALLRPARIKSHRNNLCRVDERVRARRRSGAVGFVDDDHGESS